MENFLGINPTDTFSSADDLTLPLGTEARKQKKVYRMVLAGEAITANDFVIIDPEDNTALQLDHSAAFNHGLVGVAETAISNAEYGWVTVFGVVDAANVATGAADRATLYTTATGGRLDDAGAGQYLVYNVVPLDVAASNEAEVFLDHPHVASGAEVIDVTETHSAAAYTLGKLYREGEHVYMYVEANEAITAKEWVVVTADANADATLLRETADDTAGCPVGVAETSIANTDFGWITIAGFVADTEAESGLAGHPIYASGSTNGHVVGTPGGNRVADAYLSEDEAAGTAGAVLHFPHVELEGRSDQNGTTQLHPLMTYKWIDGACWVYVQAEGGIDAYNWVAISTAGQADQLDTGNDDAGTLVGVAAEAFDDDDFGWVQVYGYVAEADCLINCARGALLYATATAGAVDDAAGGNPIMGAYMLETEGGVGADDLKAAIQFPMIYIAT